MKTCRNSTGGTRSSACPSVNVTSFVVHERVTRKLTNPAAIISGPNLLSGRRDQASSPPSTYESVIQLPRNAITSGSPRSPRTASLVRASVKAPAAAAHPPRTIAQTSGAPGARGTGEAGAWSAAEVAISTARFRPASAFDLGRNLSSATAGGSARARMKGGALADNPTPARCRAPGGDWTRRAPSRRKLRGRLRWGRVSRAVKASRAGPRLPQGCADGCGQRRHATRHGAR